MPRPPTALDKAIEAEALKYAREFVRQIREEKIEWFGVPLSWFDKPDNRRAAMEFMKKAAKDTPLAMIDLVNVARAGGDLAYDAARELILEYQHDCVEMPPSLTAFNMELIDPRHRHRKQRGQKRADNYMRDIATPRSLATCA
jgi:hypothetical protein